MRTAILLAVVMVGCGGDAFGETANRFTVEVDGAAGDAAAELGPDQADAQQLPDQVAPEAEQPGEDAQAPDAGADAQLLEDAVAAIDAQPDQVAPDAPASCSPATCPALPGGAVKCCTGATACGYVVGTLCYPLKADAGTGPEVGP